MSKAIRGNKLYQGGMMLDHCLYLHDSFKFEHETKTQYKKLIINGKTVRV